MSIKLERRLERIKENLNKKTPDLLDMNDDELAQVITGNPNARTNNIGDDHLERIVHQQALETWAECLIDRRRLARISDAELDGLITQIITGKTDANLSDVTDAELDAYMASYKTKGDDRNNDITDDELENYLRFEVRNARLEAKK
jgi:hypothetical protein